jgi:hypothetical protein
LENKTNLITFSEAEIRSLPLPSQKQHQGFVRHLRDVHSWYKGLPLLTGGKFIVFLAPDAGEGYPSQHPRLPYGNTVEGYRRAFGYLDYMYSVKGCPFERDGNNSRVFDTTIVVLPPDLIEQCEFVLYPYVSRYEYYQEYWSCYEDAIASLQAGTPHPARTQILEWKAAFEAMDIAVKTYDEISEQMRLEKEERAINASLRIQEVARIEQHLTRLYQWHSGVENFQLTNSDD